MSIRDYSNLTRQILKRRLLPNGNLPLRLGIAVTYRCNSRCSNCGIWKMKADSKTELQVGDYQKLFSDLKDQLAFVELTGGEPFMRKDLAEILISAGEILPFGTFLGVTSNGFLTDQIIKTIKSVVQKIRQPLTVGISIDGDRKMAEKVRGVSEAFAKSFETFLNLKRLAKDYPNLMPHLSYTIFPENAGRFSGFRDQMTRDFQLKDEDISIAYGQDAFLYHQKKSLILNQKPAIQDIVQARSPVKPSKTSPILKLKNNFKSFYLKTLEERILARDWKTRNCAAGDYSGFIEPDGEVYPCISWPKSLGNLRNDSIEKIWFGDHGRKIRTEIKENRCPGCWTTCEVQPTYLKNWPYLRRLRPSKKSK